MDPIGGINPSNPRPANQPQPQPQNQYANNGMTGAPVSPPSLESPQMAPVPVQLPSNLGDPFNEQQAQPVSSNSGGGNAKKIIIIVVAVIAVIGLVAGAFMLGLTTGKQQGRVEADAEYQRAQAALQQEEEAPEEAALELGALREPQYIDETVEGEIGDELSSADGLVLKVSNIERNFKSTDENYVLDESKELVKVNFLIGNVTEGRTKDISYFNFKLQDPGGAQLTPENIADYPDKFDSLKLEPGAQAKGAIVFAVAKDAKPLTFVREQRYRIPSENREVTMQTAIVVAKQ